jgi:DNA-binding MarR family transcriptional regulator
LGNVKGRHGVSTDSQVSTDQLVEELFDLWRWLRHMSYSIREGEATPQQFWLLHQLRRRGALTVGEVAEALGVSQSSATIACKRLEVAGLVRRSRRPSDERVVEISLTEEGRCTVESWRQRRRQAVAALLEPLHPDERDELERLVARVLSLATVSGMTPAS